MSAQKEPSKDKEVQHYIRELERHRSSIHSLCSALERAAEILHALGLSKTADDLSTTVHVNEDPSIPFEEAT